MPVPVVVLVVVAAIWCVMMVGLLLWWLLGACLWLWQRATMSQEDKEWDRRVREREQRLERLERGW